MRRLIALAFLALPGTAFASFHLMQIEQVIGGVDGDITEQAVVLRMRSAFQNQVQFGRIVARDAQGLNPVVVLDIASLVTHNAQGDRVLIATKNFADQQLIVPDFIATAAIPPSYLASGSLAWEQDGALAALWLICWGSYTGPTTLGTTNDVDGNITPCTVAPITSGLTALAFQFNETALSTNSAADYANSASPAVVHNNAGAAAALVTPLLVDGFEDP